MPACTCVQIAPAENDLRGIIGDYREAGSRLEALANTHYQREHEMTDTKTFQCPNCGSPLTTTGAEKEVKCPYCGSTAIVPEELRDTAEVETELQSAYQQASSQSSDQTWRDSGSSSGGSIETRSSGGRFVFVAVAVVAAIAVIIAFIVPMLSSLGSGVPSFGQSGSAATAQFNVKLPEATPTEAIPTPVPFTKLLFKDDFSNASSGWPRSRNQKYTLEYKNSAYHVLINEQGQGQEVTRSNEKSYSDVSVEVDVQQTAGPSDGLMGVTCRNDNNGNFYSFEFSQDGTYGIYKYTNDSGDSLDEETLQPNTFNQGAVNHVEGICQGDTLTLLVNGQVLSQVQDSTFTKGEVGLLARTGSSGDAGEDVLFTDFVAKGP